MQLRTFTRFHWIIHDHVIHELYCLLFYVLPIVLQKMLSFEDTMYFDAKKWQYSNRIIFYFYKWIWFFFNLKTEND
jgi:hypothetical protein